MDDHFSVESLRAALGARPFRFVETTGSTQDLTRAWAQESPAPPTGSVVIAEEQTAGRGRQGRVWYSPPDSLIMGSVILRPALAPEQLPRVVMAGGLAVAETLDPLLGDRHTLKWPNDVLVGGKKLCGILSEATWIGNELAAVVIGIGLNVRVDFTGTEMASYAANLETEIGHPVDRRALLSALLNHLDHWAARLDDPDLVAAWRARLGTLGRRVRVYPQTGTGGPYAGIAERVDEVGALFVRLESGELRRILAADVGLAEDD